MEKTQLEQLDALKAKLDEAEKNVSFDSLDKHLSRYNDFVLNIRSRVSEIVDVESFYAFRNEWRETGGICNLPKELIAYNEYLALMNQYNNIILAEMMNGNSVPKHKPLMMGSRDMELLQAVQVMYSRPFNWEHIREILLGRATKNAVYTRVVTALNPDDVVHMIRDGIIKDVTITTLPLAITERSVKMTGSERCYTAGTYHSHLAKIYDRLGMTLPELEVMELPVKGVTFEGRQEKLRYLKQHADADLSNVKLTLEPYTYHGNEGAEPAIRVIASIVGDKDFRSIDIGNIDRETALKLGEEGFENLTMAADLLQVDYFDATTDSGNVRQLFAKLKLQVAYPPVEKEKDMEQENHSEELDELFNAELLK